MGNVNASIITIGDELLIGQTIDTNSAFIGQELNKIGVWVRRRVAVGDNYDEIWDALDEEGSQSDIVIITGGLGPTADDITRPLLCNYFGGKLIVNEEVLAHVKHLFEKVFRRPGPMLERNLKQAEVPDNCIVLHNKRGTAPGMWFEAPLELRSQPSHSSVVPQGKASPNPSKGGAFESDSTEAYYYYQTTDPVNYGLLKNFAKENKAKPTLAESMLWERLRNKQLDGYKFRRQHIVRSFIADFICLPKKLIIEVDGKIHQLPDNKMSDLARTIELNQSGFQVLRFSNEEIFQKIDQVLDQRRLSLQEKSIKFTESENPPLEGREAFSHRGFRGALSSESENPPLEGREAIFISLPGVPHEMKGLMTDEVIPRLQQEFELPAIVHKTAFTAGQGESMIAELLKDFEPSLPPHIKLAYLPNYGMVKLRLTSHGDNKEVVEKELQPYFEKLQELVKEYLVSNEDEGLELVIGKILKAKGKTMATAESCTGGYIAHLITSIPGSSAYYKGTLVSYANEVKENVLGVKKKTLKNFGAVSEETVREMVKGTIHTLNVDFALATSGIMGPDGGSVEKPVGTVWIAAGNKEKTGTLKLNLRFDRQRNIEMTAANALNFLRKFILANG
ncbi:MAG: nicotinamide-nucleotide amidohydrolase family protein [Bacteroidota bacterium]